MPQDINGQFYGQLYGQDRIGQTTPDLESSEWLRPWLPVAYPAPYLPTLRQDQGHPKLAGIVLGAHQLVGQDKNGALVPAGLFCGTTPAKASGGQYCAIVYQPWDVGFAFNPMTSARVQTAGEVALLAAPLDAVAGDSFQLPNGTTVIVTWPQINFAWKCDLFGGGNIGTYASTATTTVDLVPTVTAATSGAGSVASFVLGTSTDLISGQVTVQVGSPVTVTPVVVASTLLAGSTATFTFAKATDLVTGSGSTDSVVGDVLVVTPGTLQFKVGLTGTLVTVDITNLSIANAVVAINAAIANAGVVGVVATSTATTIVVTGPDDTVQAGNNTLTIGTLQDVPSTLTVTLAGVAGAAAVTAINSAVTTAGLGSSFNATPAAFGTKTLTITGAVGVTNTLVVVSDLDDVGTAGTLVPYSYGTVRPIGCAVRNVYQYIGGVLVGQNPSATPSATGINYILDGVVPINFAVLNYMHEMGTAVQTQFVLKLPWIGESPTALSTFATNDGVQGYQQLFGRTFTHFTGPQVGTVGTNGQVVTVGPTAFSFGSGVTWSNLGNGTDAGNFTVWNPNVNSTMDLVGRVIGIQNLAPVGFLNRVRTLFDRPMVGPMVDPNPASIRMGGSATGGIPYHISVTTDALFKRAYDQGKTLRPAYSTHVIVRVNL
jgi:hypothetical protein